MTSTPDDLPSDLASALAALADREARLRVEVERDVAQTEASNWQAEATKAQAMLYDTEARIAHLELRIEKLKRDLYGQRSERTARLIEQLELRLEETWVGPRRARMACRERRGGEDPERARLHAQATARPRQRSIERRARASSSLPPPAPAAADRGCPSSVRT